MFNIKTVQVLDINDYLGDDDIRELADYLDVSTGTNDGTLVKSDRVREGLIDLADELNSSAAGDLREFLYRRTDDLLIRFPN
jgi:hypothetical protein